MFVTRDQDCKTMWLARDQDGKLYLFEEKPIKDIAIGEWYSNQYYDACPISPYLFPKVTWLDDEPTEVEITIKTKKPTLKELYKDNSLGETLIIDE